jgi:hypothetical protein
LRLAVNVAGISGIAETDALIAENFLHLDSTIDSQVSFPRFRLQAIWQLSRTEILGACGA